ncbi:MAG: hypothetical protein ABL966_05145 [Acidimicrobiales bacterium]
MTATLQRVAVGADRWLFAPESAGRVRTMRAMLAALIALRLATGPAGGLGGQPAALFRPVWFLSWMGQTPSVGVLVAIQVVGVAAAALAVLGWRERGTFLVAWSSLLVLAALRASRGKVQHNDLPLVLVAGVLAAAPAGLRLLDPRRSRAWGWPVRTSLVVVTGIYFLTGLQKLLTSGPAWVLSDNLRNVMYGARLNGKAPTDVVSLFIADRPWLAHLAALATLLIELGAVVALVRPRARPAYVVAIVLLHSVIYLTHGLDYSMWAATAAIVLVDWDAWLRRVMRTRDVDPS